MTRVALRETSRRELDLLEALAAGRTIQMRRSFPFPHRYTVTGGEGVAPEDVDGECVRALSARGYIAARPIDAVWDQVDFAITDRGRAELARLRPEPARPPAPVRSALILIPPKTHASTCKRCRKPIYWVTRKGARHPVSVNMAANEACQAPTGTTWGQGISHMDDCPYAHEFRRVGV
jgi:hypothetical protein